MPACCQVEIVAYLCGCHTAVENVVNFDALVFLDHKLQNMAATHVRQCVLWGVFGSWSLVFTARILTNSAIITLIVSHTGRTQSRAQSRRQP